MSDYKNVPIVPTEAMVAAGKSASLEGDSVYADPSKDEWDRFGKRVNRVLHIYNAMLAASPPSGGEAVAWLCDAGDGANIQAVTSTHARDTYAYAGRKITPLYTSPRVVDVSRMLTTIENAGFQMANYESTVASDAYDPVASGRRQLDFKNAIAALQAALGEGK